MHGPAGPGLQTTSKHNYFKPRSTSTPAAPMIHVLHQAWLKMLAIMAHEPPEAHQEIRLCTIRKPDDGTGPLGSRHLSRPQTAREPPPSPAAPVRITLSSIFSQKKPESMNQCSSGADEIGLNVFQNASRAPCGQAGLENRMWPPLPPETTCLRQAVERVSNASYESPTQF
ncbi:hypothetical protein K504DRAFT_502963 [Pleomassaria siparia CBS 279.74]|uniref:Uncharacterized protein n=1 Tax=Pleomassaria siparia CBS 279.74 TaxID=1314801 RepID=A0A6G1K944_9PLEO|nr:hypothetical protein K504DRAFT_502963 [Pleomassaria siparia CBS 279.74]